MNALALTVDPLALHDLVPPASIEEARAFRDDLGRLLRRERVAAADFLVALADFDRRRGWERLGHASLFSFLTRELRLSSGSAQLRLSAARLLPRHPAVEEALRAGHLCISAVGQLARVLTPANEAEVLPRFFGLSAREAQEVVAAIRPDPAPPRREVVTPLLAARPVSPAAAQPMAPPAAPRPEEVAAAAAEVRPAADSLHTYEVRPTAQAPVPPAAVEPLTADLRRLHLTVSRQLLEKVAKARDGLSHALPCATTEQVLETALDLLLEKQTRARALVRRLRTARPPASAPARTASPAPAPIPIPDSPLTPPNPRAIPAAVERAVRLRDGDRCAFPLDAGGVCGSTWQVELDHVVPVALGGQATVANLRCACRRHNRLAAEAALGERTSCRGIDRRDAAAAVSPGPRRGPHDPGWSSSS